MHSLTKMPHRLWIFFPLLLALLPMKETQAAEEAQVDATAAAKPNVLVIIVDDFPYERFTPINGYKEGLMPHIGSIWEQGISFPQGYVSGCVCAPTRAGLMTGRYQSRYGYESLTGSIKRQIDDDYGVDVEEVLMPQILKEEGYRTGLFGKWHLGYNPHYRPNARGIDQFFGFLPGGHSYTVWDQTRRGFERERMGGPIYRNEDEIDGEGYLTTVMAEEGAQFIRTCVEEEEPFFVYFSPFNVHAPIYAPSEYIHEGDDVMDGMIRALDTAVGIFLATLEETGTVENTLVVFVNDNGGLHDVNAPFRAGKGSLYEGGIRSPFAMQWPGHFAPGTTYDHPVIQLDVLPTVVAAAGGALPDDREYDGVNLLPFLTNERDATERPHEMLAWRDASREQCAIRLGDLKYINASPRKGGGRGLYDLSVDPGESNNLAEERPDDVRRLMEAYREWHDQIDPPAIPEFNIQLPH